MVPQDYIVELIQTYGVWAVFIVVGLESIGIPMPGELVLILASTFRRDARAQPAADHCGRVRWCHPWR